jgi:hypothetical protein
MKQPLSVVALFLGVALLLLALSSAQWVSTNAPFGGAVRKLAVIGTNLFAATENVGVSLSTNNGTNWTVVNSGLPPNPLVHTLAVSGTNLFASVSSRGVYLSTNNGATVNPGFPNATINIMSLATSGGNLFAAASGTGVYRSTNNGANWTTFNTGLSNTTVMSLAVVGTNLFAGTFGSGVWRIAVPTSVKEVGGASPKSFALEQNYPNPFNPTTTISFRIPLHHVKGSNSPLVSLEVFDLLGREVATLVKRELSPGNYSAMFDAKHLVSGVYFYRLSFDSFSETKRMMLLK